VPLVLGATPRSLRDYTVDCEARMVRFHQWRRDRDAWLARTGVTCLAVFNEDRRRAAVWQRTHPPDRGLAVTMRQDHQE
jgi:hypothetical protein